MVYGIDRFGAVAAEVVGGLLEFLLHLAQLLDGAADVRVVFLLLLGLRGPVHDERQGEAAGQQAARAGEDCATGRESEQNPASCLVPGSLYLAARR